MIIGEGQLNAIIERSFLLLESHILEVRKNWKTMTSYN